MNKNQKQRKQNEIQIHSNTNKENKKTTQYLVKFQNITNMRKPLKKNKINKYPKEQHKSWKTKNNQTITQKQQRRKQIEQILKMQKNEKRKTQVYTQTKVLFQNITKKQSNIT